MKKDLSSRLTYIYKFILPFIWTGIVVWATYFLYNHTKELWTFLLLLMILPLLITLKPKFISYDNEHVFISNGRTQRVYEIKRLKAINEPYNFSDPFFEIELFGDRGQTEKFEFMARVNEQLNYFASGQLSGRLLELKDKIEGQVSK